MRTNLAYVLTYMIPDKLFLQHKYRQRMGRACDLRNPKRYTEKLNWLKLNDKNPQYIQFVDKYAVKEYVGNIIGHEHIIPTYGVWDHFDDIDFNALPDSFVLKCTHDSGGIYIVKDKKNMNLETARQIIENALKRDYSIFGREWPYKYVKRRIIAEQYLEDSVDKELRDYKFFCFDGNVPYMFVATDRFNNSDTCFDFFDSDFNHLEIINGHPNAKTVPHKPQNFEIMIDMSKRLSEGYPHLRVDFYEVNGDVYFGEITLYHHSGFVPFEPDEWDYKFGEYLKLPRRS